VTVDLCVQSSQKQFSNLIGVSENAVSGLVRRGVIVSGQSLGEWLHLYCSHIREQAAGRATLGELDLATERAGLAREQRIRLEMQNAVTRQEYGPIVEMEFGLSSVMSMIGKKLDSIPGEIKKQSNVLTAVDLDVVAKIIVVVRNDISDLRINWFGDVVEEDEESEIMEE